MPVSRQDRIIRVKRSNHPSRSRRTVRLDTSWLTRPTNRRVTFDIVSTTNSPRYSDHPSSPLTSQDHDEDGRDIDVNNTPMIQLSDRMTRPSTNVEDLDVAGEHSNRAQHNVDSLYIRRTKNRHQRAQTRRRHVNQSRSVLLCGQCSPKSQILLSSLLFIIILTTYLLLCFNTQLATPLHVILVLLLVFSAVLFFHGVLRSWVAHRLPHIYEGRTHASSRSRHVRHRGRRRGAADYITPQSPFDSLPMDDSLFTPTTPVRVHLFRDEEELIGEKEPAITVDTFVNSPNSIEDDAAQALPTPPPPAYGLWRCSVKADPNLLHWSRCDLDGLGADGTTCEPRMASAETEISSPAEPPSYTNDHRNSTVSCLETLEVSGASFIPPQGSSQVPRGIEGDVVLTEEDRPLRDTNDAVQEVTRRLLEDQRRHTIL